MKFMFCATFLGGALLLSSFAPPQRFSDALLTTLDPGRIAALQCGAREVSGGLLQALLIASAAAAEAPESGPIPLFDDLTASTFPLTTNDPEARRYFSQGLLLSYGFNHAGAVRSFRAAQARDPGCAMCWWGEAVALGPNINAPMEARDRAAALYAVDKAMHLRERASPLERAMIEAAALRYARDPAADRATLDAAYADAMLAAAGRFPDNDDLALLAAEAAMNTTPWNYWEADKRTPIGRIGKAISLVDAVLARNPDHPQAGHLAIHLYEASDPRRAEAAADRLARPVTPSAAHLVHMPGHIYQLLGRHADSIRVNIAAARADEAFIRKADDHGLVRYGYYPHNVHFIVTSAQIAGDAPTAIREARRLRRLLDVDTSAKIAWIQAIDAAPFFAMAQVAAPRAILAMPAPDLRLPYAVGARHYARAIAYAQRRNQAGFDQEIAAIAALRSSGALDGLAAQGMPAADLLLLAEEVAQARWAAAQGRQDEAIARYRAAIKLQDAMPYQEPSLWYYPVEQSLGAALFLSGRHEEASAAFRAALARTPNNGWALWGLMQSEAALGRDLEAAAARQAFSKAWLGGRARPRMERL